MELNEIDNLSEIEDKYYDALDWGKNLKSILYFVKLYLLLFYQ